MVQTYKPEIEPIENNTTSIAREHCVEKIREGIGKANDYAHRLQNLWIEGRNRSIDEDFITECKAQEQLLRRFIIDLDRYYDRIKS